MRWRRFRPRCTVGGGGGVVPCCGVLAFGLYQLTPSGLPIGPQRETQRRSMCIQGLSEVSPEGCWGSSLGETCLRPDQ